MEGSFAHEHCEKLKSTYVISEDAKRAKEEHPHLFNNALTMKRCTMSIRSCAMFEDHGLEEIKSNRRIDGLQSFGACTCIHDWVKTGVTGNMTSRRKRKRNEEQEGTECDSGSSSDESDKENDIVEKIKKNRKAVAGKRLRKESQSNLTLALLTTTKNARSS